MTSLTNWIKELKIQDEIKRLKKKYPEAWRPNDDSRLEDFIPKSELQVFYELRRKTDFSGKSTKRIRPIAKGTVKYSQMLRYMKQGKNLTEIGKQLHVSYIRVKRTVAQSNELTELNHQNWLKTRRGWGAKR